MEEQNTDGEKIVSLDWIKYDSEIRHYKFNDDKDVYILVLDTNVVSDCDDENVVLKSVWEDNSVTVLWFQWCKDMSIKVLVYNDVRTC